MDLERVAPSPARILSGWPASTRAGSSSRAPEKAREHPHWRKNGDPVIVDFGISRMLEATALTPRLLRIAQFGYMAPEQLRGEPVTEPADIFRPGRHALRVP